MFFDRTFCYHAASYPDYARVLDGMSRKRISLVLASEETYPGASLGIVHQIQEFSRYTHSDYRIDTQRSVQVWPTEPADP